MKRRKPSIQTHHITYNPPWTVRVWVGEHWVLTQLQRRKRISTGLITGLEDFIAKNKDKAVELDHISLVDGRPPEKTFKLLHG